MRSTSGWVDAFLLHYVPFSAMMVLRGKPRGSLPENGRWLGFNQRACTLCVHRTARRNLWKGGQLMSDFEMLSIVLMILGIIVALVIAYVQATKK